jgi:hypothetical protein
LSDTACQALARALLTNTTLVSIDLLYNQLHDSDLSANTMLHFLDLCYNFLTASNLRMLADCRNPSREIRLQAPLA